MSPARVGSHGIGATGIGTTYPTGPIQDLHTLEFIFSPPGK